MDYRTCDIYYVPSATGRQLVARLLRPGDPYGRDNCMVWGEDAGRGIVDPVLRAGIQALNAQRLGIEFWDTTPDPRAPRKSELGNFTGARYYLGDILKGINGLCLMGGEPAWNIEAKDMATLRDWTFTRI